MSARFFLAAAALFLAGAAQADPTQNEWSLTSNPTSGPPQIIGSPADGCLAGAVALASEGPGFEVLRLSRRRYFGHPDTIAFVQRLGRHTQAGGLPIFYVGDIAQPRGGPLPYGHASHQTGLDVDIFFDLEPKPRLSSTAREDVTAPSMVRADHHDINPLRFGASQVALLRLAASDPRVDRIFVNPLIKQALCRGFGGAGQGDRAWLRRIRPWYGHDDHFHVRLSCPANARECEAQSPLPAGDGCGEDLAWWFREETPPVRDIAGAEKIKPPLPEACRAVLATR